MPRQVDHAVRRQDIAAALWRVVRRDGIQHVSVRTVAAEAGTSPSALRHYFASQDELLGFALQAMMRRVQDRIEPALPALRGRDGACRILAELLPLDPERRDEMEVYFAFLGRAHTDPRLTAIRDEAEAASRTAVRYAVDLLADAGRLGAGRDPGAETDRLYPLVDGLAVHGTLWPAAYPAEHLRKVLYAHLDEIAAPAPPAERAEPAPPAEPAASAG